MIPLLITYASAVLEQTSQSQEVAGTVCLTLSGSSVDPLELARLLEKKPLDEKELEKLSLEFFESNGIRYLWDSRIYSAKNTSQRLSLWRKLAKGECKVGDVIDLGNYYGAIAGSHPMLAERFGLTKENAEGVSAGIYLNRIVTIEAPDGTRTRVSLPESGDDGQFPKLKPNAPLPKSAGTKLAHSSGSIISNDEVKTLFFDFKTEPLDRFASAGKCFEYLYNLQVSERDELLTLVQQFKGQLQNAYPDMMDGNLSLNERDRAHIENQLLNKPGGKEKWAGYKVVSSETSPNVAVSFWSGPDTASGVLMQLDTPAAQKAKVKP